MQKLNWFLFFLRLIGADLRNHRKGIRISQINRDAYKYYEGDHILIFVAEWHGNEYAISRASIDNWLPPFEHEVITDADNQRIIKNISDFFDYRGYQYSIDDH